MLALVGAPQGMLSFDEDEIIGKIREIPTAASHGYPCVILAGIGQNSLLQVIRLFFFIANTNFKKL